MTPAGSKPELKLFLFVLAAWCIAAVADVEPKPTVVFEAESHFNDRVFVIDDGGFRALVFGDRSGNVQSLMEVDHPERLQMPYLESAAVGLAGLPDDHLGLEQLSRSVEPCQRTLSTSR
jgi:hypothetical protein